MRLQHLTAIPHPMGNRIDLSWVNPHPDEYPGVRVIRREKTHPQETHPRSPTDGVLVAEGAGLTAVVDQDLKGETVYYYSLFPYRSAPPDYVIDRHNRTAAMAGAPYGLAKRMFDLLPAIYHRYDTVWPKQPPPEMAEADRQRGQLQRFLDLPGAQLDQLYSLAKAALDLHDIEQVDGRLLPLLAQWIGWPTDYRQEIAKQRNEIRFAPHIYKTVGIIPTVEATVKRIIGWESRAKEFVHSIFFSNRPEQLNIWASYRLSNAVWSAPAKPLSLNFAYEGRPTIAHNGHGTYHLFYHTLKKKRWEIWYKTLSTFTLGSEFQADLRQGIVSTALQQAFRAENFSLSQNAFIEEKEENKLWLITDLAHDQIYTVAAAGGGLKVYHWSPSQPLTQGPGDNRHPTAIFQRGVLRLFWDSYVETDEGGLWQINYCSLADGLWSPMAKLATSTTEPQPERRQPWVVVDSDGLWLFWLEKIGPTWQLKYNRHNALDWDDETGHPFLQPALEFPLDNGFSPGIGSDPFVLFQPTDAARPLWLFWAQRGSTGAPGQTRWQVAYRFKQSLDPAVADWSEVLIFDEAGSHHDAEPAAAVNRAGDIELFFSSKRQGSWSIWHSTLLDVASNTWTDAQQITSEPYNQRDPLPLSIGEHSLLLYRSNQSLIYTSPVYGATDTLDFRYAGSTTVDTHNLARTALRGQYGDFQTYTYDTGQAGQRTNDDWYARDTVGIYLTPSTEDPTLILRNQDILESVLRQFLPIQIRPVFIIAEPTVYREFVYTYDFPDEVPRYIEENVFDQLRSPISELYSGLGDSHVQDVVPEWSWIYAWSEANPNQRTVDFSQVPATNTNLRTWHTGLEEIP